MSDDGSTLWLAWSEGADPNILQVGRTFRSGFVMICCEWWFEAGEPLHTS